MEYIAKNVGITPYIVSQNHMLQYIQWIWTRGVVQLQAIGVETVAPLYRIDIFAVNYMLKWCTHVILYCILTSFIASEFTRVWLFTLSDAW